MVKHITKIHPLVTSNISAQNWGFLLLLCLYNQNIFLNTCFLSFMFFLIYYNILSCYDMGKLHKQLTSCQKHLAISFPQLGLTITGPANGNAIYILVLHIVLNILLCKHCNNCILLYFRGCS